MFRGELHQARLLVSIAFMVRRERFLYLFDLVRCLAEADTDLMDVRIVVDSFDVTDKESIQNLLLPFCSPRFQVTISSFWNANESKIHYFFY